MAGIELKHLCLEYMTPWLLNLVRFCKHNDDAKRQRVTAILDKLITMTINEKQMYPSIQAKIWGSLGQVSGPQGQWGAGGGDRGCGRRAPDAAAVSQITDLLDVVLDSFIKTSATGGLGSIKAEVMADTAVALASGNVKLVSSKVSHPPWSTLALCVRRTTLVFSCRLAAGPDRPLTSPLVYPTVLV